MSKQVLVTGATGQTGSIVLKKIRQQPSIFKGLGFARSSEKVKEIFDSETDFFFGDIRDLATLDKAIIGCDALVILTSATPQIKAPPKPGERPQFEYPQGSMPEDIDYQGQKNQIDAAIASGIKHIVLVGSMGGTNENHPLNKMGNGKILIWKRKAEQYLIDSEIDYTIIRAGGLLNQPGGKRELLVGKNDELLTNPPDGINPSIPREDVAETVVRALQESNARNKAFDLISKPEDDDKAYVTKDFAALFAQTTGGL